MEVRQCELRRMLLLQAIVTGVQKSACLEETRQERDTAEGCILLLFQLFAEMSITFIAVYPSYISGRCESYSLKAIFQFF
jgi:hypothetical protein